MDSQLASFVVVAAVLTVTPGADMALVTRHALEGRAAALATTVGICMGCLVHAVASALGLSLILARSTLAFEVLKYVGGSYLIYLGVQALRGAVSASAEAACSEGTGASVRGAARGRSGRCFLDGFLTNLLNPKVGVFYLTFLPQFISPRTPALQGALLLASIHISMGLTWLTAYTLLIDRFAAILGSPRVRRRMQRVTGALLMGLGVRLAFERR